MSLGQTDPGAVPPTGSDTSDTMLGDVSPEPPSAVPAADPPAADQGSDAESEPSSALKRKPDPKLCGVCGTQPSKYKCPRCTLPYCSVACNKQHKENHPPDPPKPTPPPTTTSSTSQSQEPSSSDPYSILLDHRTTFSRLFEKYPSLPAELSRIQQTTLPPTENPSFSKLPNIPGLNNNNNKNKQQQPWTRDVGLRRGADALRRARTDPGDVGDGVREFCELVLFLLGKAQLEREGQGRTGAGGATERVREEVAAEEARVIERLLREEGGRDGG